jgi:pyridoxal 5'-phosphate synthase pdxT subunit
VDIKILEPMKESGRPGSDLSVAQGELPPALPVVGVLAIQGDFEAHAAALREAGAEPVLVRRPEQLGTVDGLIIPGGESTTFLKFLERDGFLGALQSFVYSKPTFGTCAGCILLAKEVTNPTQASLGVLDATVERNAYGRQIDSAIETSVTKLDGGPMELVYIRAPRIVKTGAGVKILAERSGFPVLVEQGHILAATFHPELSADRRVHRRFVELVREDCAARSSDNTVRS